jgi:hypothetical protein
MMRNFRLEIENADELKKLLDTAKKQLEQLNETFEEINDFKLKLKSQVDGQCKR